MKNISLPTYGEIAKKLLQFEKDYGTLNGINSPARRNVFIKQIIDSTRNIEYCKLLTLKKFNKNISDPSKNGFNPIKASIYHFQNNNFDEALWLIFLTIYFGKAKPGRWNLIRAFYGGLNLKYIWDWKTLTNNQKKFHRWIANEKNNLKSYGKFGNHRKYESLNHTSRSIDSYLNWVGANLSHKTKFDNIKNNIGNNPNDLFDYLFNDLSIVYRFGRMTKFDFLCMIGKLNFLRIEPRHPYLTNSTGPLSGSKLLFGKLPTRQLTDQLVTLGSYLNLPFVMQILEDAICNWQKSPSNYTRFTG
ncbi:MAG: hypothetical protein WD607_06210 [Candidatus Paceibacterota bacterium]